MIMSCCSSNSSTSSHLHYTSLLNRGFSKVLASTRVTIPSPPKTPFTIPQWKYLSTGGPDGAADRRPRERRLHDAYLYLEDMVSKGHVPDTAQSKELVYDLCRRNKLRKAARVMELTVAATGRPPDDCLLNHIVQELCRRGNLGFAMELVDKMESLYGHPPSKLTYNLLVRGHCDQGNLSESLQFMEQLVQRGLEPDAFTFSFLLEAACKYRGADEAERLMEEIVAKGGNPSVVGYNVLMTGFCKEHRLGDAMRLFRSLPSKGFQPNIVSYNIILRRLCFDGLWDEVEELLADMGGRGCSPTLITYNILAGSLAARGRSADALEVLDEMARNGYPPTVGSYNHILAQFCREGDVAAVRACLDSMMIQRHLAPSDGTYNAVAQMCLNPPGLVHEAMDILERLCNHHPSNSRHNFFRGVVISLCRKGNTLAAFRLLPEMARVGFPPDSCTYSALIRGLCADGMLDEAVEVMRLMEEEGVWGRTGKYSLPNLDNYHALLSGFCKAHRTDLALEMYVRMVERGLKPNETTYVILVEGIANEDESKLAADVLTELHGREAVKKGTVDKIALEYDLDLVLLS